MSNSENLCPTCGRPVPGQPGEEFPTRCICGHDFSREGPLVRRNSHSVRLLLLMLTPAAFGLLFISKKSSTEMFVTFYIGAAICCYVASTGFLRAYIKTAGWRILASLLLGTLVFLLNMVVFLYVGCSSGRL